MYLNPYASTTTKKVLHAFLSKYPPKDVWVTKSMLKAQLQELATAVIAEIPTQLKVDQVASTSHPYGGPF